MADDIATRQEDYLQQVSFNGIVLDNMSKSLNLDIPDHIKDITNTAVDKNGVADISDWRFLVTEYGGNSGAWDETYTAVFPNSANWDYAFLKAIQPDTNNSALTSVYTTVNDFSANWNSVYSSYNTQSATGGGSGGIAASANWNSVYSSFNSQSANNALVNVQFSSNSANWNSVFSSFNSQSAIGLPLSANWNSVYSSFNSQSAIGLPLSANWNSVYSSFNAQSGANVLVNNAVNSGSANWNSVYSAFNSQSGSNTVVNSIVNSSSANWNSTYSTFSSQSANFVVGPSSSTNNNFVWFNGSTGKLVKDSGLTMANLSGVGRVAQFVVSASNIEASSTAVIPADATIPQIGEGAAYTPLDTPFTPLYVNSTILIEVYIFATTAASSSPEVTMFKNNDANALAGSIITNNANWPCIFNFSYAEPSGSTALRTYKIRYGNTAGSTMWINRITTTPDFWGSALIAQLKITEFLP